MVLTRIAFATRSEIVEAGELTSVAISKDSRFAIAAHLPNEIILVHLKDGSVLRRYTGYESGSFVTQSAYGGATDNYILSGGAGTSPLQSPLARQTQAADRSSHVPFSRRRTSLRLASGHGRAHLCPVWARAGSSQRSGVERAGHDRERER